METRRIVPFEGGEVAVRRLSLVDLIMIRRAESPESEFYVQALPKGFDLAAVPIAGQVAILNAVMELNGDLARQMTEVAEGMATFPRGQGRSGRGARRAGRRSGRDLEDAPGEPAASAVNGRPGGAPR